MTHFAVLIPVAKQIAWACGIIAVLTPMTRPFGIDQRTAGIAGIQRSIGLNDIVHEPARRRAQGAAQRRNDARGHGLRVAERIADGDRDLTDLQASTESPNST